MKPFALLFPGMSGPPENMNEGHAILAVSNRSCRPPIETPKCGNVSIERGLGKVLVNGIKVH